MQSDRLNLVSGLKLALSTAEWPGLRPSRLWPVLYVNQFEVNDLEIFALFHGCTLILGWQNTLLALKDEEPRTTPPSLPHRHMSREDAIPGTVHTLAQRCTCPSVRYTYR